ncbi:MAG: PaaI family thioesterase [Xanthobacteraceae bacterium]|nr:PaaI family thioesterase [Xanthobacteraceae bacterium]
MHDEAPALVCASVAAPPFHRWLAPQVVAVAADEVTIRLPLRPEFRRSDDADGIHGGVVAALIDIAGHAAVVAAVGHGVPTINLRVDYLRMASGDALVARARPVRVGRTIALIDIEVTSGDGRLVAVGRGSFSTQAG